MSPRRRWERVQAEHWEHAKPRHFLWKTTDPFFSTTEAELLGWIEPRGRLLEVGCGEGSNLWHLRRDPSSLFGLDTSASKVTFARSRLPELRGVVADGAALPFSGETFDTILVRDVLHHVSDRSALLAECWRVLAPGGSLWIVEANGRNPLILAQALAVGAERGLLRSSPERLELELGALHPGAEISMAQPLALARLVLHPELGLPELGRSRLVQLSLRAVSSWGGRLLPERSWGYARARVRKGP